MVVLGGLTFSTSQLYLITYSVRHASEGKFVNFALLNSPQRMFYLIFYHDQNLRFCLPVSSDYLLFVLGEKEKCL